MMATGAGGVCRERFLDSVGEDMVALSSCERQRAQWRGRHISTGPQITGRHGLDRQPGLPHRVTGPMNRVHGLAPDRSKLLQKKRQIQATRIRSPWIRSAIQIWDPEPHPFGFPFQPLKVGIPMWSHTLHHVDYYVTSQEHHIAAHAKNSIQPTCLPFQILRRCNQCSIAT
jgi:hypothetical protein